MSAQEDFDRTYITSSEICRRVGVTRAAIVKARRQGALKDLQPINVEDQLMIWRRTDAEPAVLKWIEIRNARIGVV